MPRGIDDLSKMLEMLERAMKPYKSPEVVSGIATALSANAENPVLLDASERLNGPMVRFATQTARALENPLSGIEAAEAQNLMAQNPGIAQAVSSYADFTSGLNFTEGLSRAAEIEGLGLDAAIDWLPRSGLEEAIERNHIFENRISGALDAARPIFADIDRYHSAIDDMSLAVMGLSGILQSASPVRSVISNICKAIPATLSMWEFYHQIDTDLLCGVADRVLARNETWTVDSAAEAITQEYDTEVSKHWHTDAKDEVDETGKLVALDPKRIDPEKVRDWILAIIQVISFIYMLIGATGAINININNSFNSVKQTNNYYIIKQGANAEFLNGCCYRIVNRETKARLKRDCHSAVVGTLKEGQVVIIRDKHKKWIQVEWENEDGETCLGWIQNYKVTEFEHKSINR